MMLFAQAGGAGNPGLDDVLAVVVVSVCVMLIVVIVVGVFFLLTLQRCLARCEPQNRTMDPGQVWLNLIPCFNIFWQFVTVNRISESLRNEFRSRGVRRSTDYGKSLGIASLCLNIAANVIGRVSDAAAKGGGGGMGAELGVAFVSLGLGFASFVCFVMYWFRIAQYSRQLSTGDYGDEDAYDDRDRDDVGRGRYDDDGDYR